MNKSVLASLLISFTINVYAGNNYINDSPIVFDTKESVFYGNIQFCWRNRDGSVPLNDIGIDDHDILKGLSCIVGDYDGNGYVDFAFEGKKTIDRKVISYLKVLFYEKKKVIREILLPGGYFFLYPATDKKGSFGEPASKNDGFEIPGEGGTTRVYLFDPTTEQFNISEHASENH